jgi:hypothetical protein
MQPALVRFGKRRKMETTGMSRDAHWVQREMRAMSDEDRDAYIQRSRLSYDETIEMREIYAKYKLQIQAIEKQRNMELELTRRKFVNMRKALGL